MIKTNYLKRIIMIILVLILSINVIFALKIDKDHCSNYECNNIAFNGNGLQLMANESVNILIPFQGGVYDVSHNAYNIIGNSSTYVTGRETNTLAYRLRDADDSWLNVTSKFNKVSFDGTFISKQTHEEPVDNAGQYIVTSINPSASARNGFLLRKSDDNGSYQFKLADADGLQNEDSQNTNLDIDVSYTIGYVQDCNNGVGPVPNPSFFYYQNISETYFASDYLNTNCDTWNVTENWWSLYANPYEINEEEVQGDVQFVQFINKPLTSDQYIDCGLSKYGCFLETVGTTKMNYTLDTGTEGIDVSFNADELDSQANVCFMIEQDINPQWYCKNTTNIPLSSPTDEINITLLFNTTNTSKTPIFKGNLIITANNPKDLFVSALEGSCNDALTREQNNESNPWCSLDEFDKMESGDITWVKNGNYTTDNNYNHKVLTSKTILTSYPGHTPTIARKVTQWENVPNAEWINLSTSDPSFAMWKSNRDVGADTPTAIYLSNLQSLFTYRGGTDDLDDLNLTTAPEGILRYSGDTYLHLDDPTANPNNIPIRAMIYTILTFRNVTGAEFLIENLTFWSGDKGVYIRAGCDNITIRNNNFISGLKPIDIRDSSNILIENNDFFMQRNDNWTWVEQKSSLMEVTAVWLQENLAGNIIRFNNLRGYFNGISDLVTSSGLNDNLLIYNNTLNDMFDDAIEVEEYGNNYKIYNNYINNSFIGISLVPFDSDTALSMIYNNIIIVNRTIPFDDGVQYFGECFKFSNNDPARNINITHNTCVGRGVYADAIYTHNQFDVNWIDNIFYATNSLVLQPSSLAADGVFYDYNLYFRETGVGLFQYWNNDADATVFNTLALARASGNWDGNWDNHSLNEDPLFTDITSLNLIPAYNSPVCGAASDGTDIGAVPCAIDPNPPTYSLASANNTLVNLSTEFGLLVDDDLALEPNGQYIFSTNNSGSWVNDSAVNFTSTPEWANVTKVLNETTNIGIGYRWYLTDNIGNVVTTPIYTVNTTNTIPPTYSLASTNNTLINLSTEFGLLVVDDITLEPNGQYIFSTNNSGVWVNDSAVNFISTPEWANVTKVLNETPGLSIGYRWYLTDNFGNAVTTPIYTVNTTEIIIIGFLISLPDGTQYNPTGTVIVAITVTDIERVGYSYMAEWVNSTGDIVETDNGTLSNILGNSVFETYITLQYDQWINAYVNVTVNNISQVLYFNVTGNASTSLIINDAKFSPEAKLGAAFAVDFRVMDNNFNEIDKAICSVFGIDINGAPLQDCTEDRDSVTHNGRGICSGLLDPVPFEEGQQYLAKIRCSCGIGDKGCFSENGSIVEKRRGEVSFVFQVTPWLDSVNTITDKDSYTVDDDILVCANITNLNDERLSLNIIYNWRCQNGLGDQSTDRIIIESHIEERGISSNTTQNQCAKFRVPDEIIIEKGAVNCYASTEVVVFNKQKVQVNKYNTVSDIFIINVTDIHPIIEWKQLNNYIYEAEFSIEDFNVGIKNIDLFINPKITDEFTPSTLIKDFSVTYANGSAIPYDTYTIIEREFRNLKEEDLIEIFIKDVNTTLNEEFKVIVTFYDNTGDDKIIAIVLAYGIIIAFFTYFASFVMKKRDKDIDHEKNEKMIEDLKEI